MAAELGPEGLRRAVGAHFTTLGLHWDADSVYVPIAVPGDESRLEEAFDALRRELISQSFIPMLIRDKGELGVYITRKPPARYRSPYLNLALLLATICTTVLAGSLTWASYEDLEPFSQRAVAYGTLFFAVPLMLILGVHELSHYYAAKRHGVAASLPFFIPALPPLGTFGAFISIREPIPSRKALMDIGVAGPIGGFVMTILVTILGLHLSGLFHIPTPEDAGGLIYLGTPLLFEGLSLLVGTNPGYLLHPTAFAGWVGFLVTGLNLLPAGQLDGGHVARALLGERARYAGYAAVGALVLLSIFSEYPAWVVFILLILFLGLYHPPPLNDVTRLDRRGKTLGALGIVVLLVTFVPTPMIQVEPTYDLRLLADTLEGNAPPNGSVNYTIYIENRGNIGTDMRLEASFADPDDPGQGWSANLSKRMLFVPASGYRELNLSVFVPEGAAPGNRSAVNVTAFPVKEATRKRHIELTTTAGFLRVSADGAVKFASPPPGQRGSPRAVFSLTIAYLENMTPPAHVNLSVEAAPGWGASPGGSFSIELSYGRPVSFELFVYNVSEAAAGERCTVVIRAEALGNASRSHELELTVLMSQLYSMEFFTQPLSLSIPRGGSGVVSLTLRNTGNGPDEFELWSAASPGLSVGGLPDSTGELGPGGVFNCSLTIAADAAATPGLLSVRLGASSTGRPAVLQSVVVGVAVE
ncbi:MAG: site-2 protease family protein [Thermoplasmatota archaeon]